MAQDPKKYFTTSGNRLKGVRQPPGGEHPKIANARLAAGKKAKKAAASPSRGVGPRPAQLGGGTTKKKPAATKKKAPAKPKPSLNEVYDNAMLNKAVFKGVKSLVSGATKKRKGVGAKRAGGKLGGARGKMRPR